MTAEATVKDGLIRIRPDKKKPWPTYPEDCVLLVTTLRLAALRMSLSNVATIWVNLGRMFLSFTQQSSMS